MPQFLENSAIQLAINPFLARWSASSRYLHSPALDNIQLSLGYWRGRSHKHVLDRWPDYNLEETEITTSPHGPGKVLQLCTSSPDNIKSTVTFVLPINHPLLLWKVSINNQSSRAVNLDKIELFSAGYIHRGRQGPHGQINIPGPAKTKTSPSSDSRAHAHPPRWSFYSNGWQSWSYSGSYTATDQYQQTSLGFLRTPLVKNAGTPNPRRRGIFASDMYAVLGDRYSRNGFLIGFLSQKKHFGSLETWLGGSTPSLKVWANGDSARLNPGGQMETDWACLMFMHLDQPDPMAPYLEAVMREHHSRAIQSQPPTGWCSWYQFSSEDYIGQLNAGNIQDNLQSLCDLNDQIPLEIIQIDDGFETQVGDWYSFNQGFPDGLVPLAREIRDKEFTPGLWLAPFIAHPKSKLADQHPDWMLRNRFGRKINAGYLWNSFPQALDLTHPAAQEYVSEVIHSAVQKWGFSYLKLDFLYAAALPGRHMDGTQTRAQVLRSGLETIREAAGDRTFLLGCGCPLGPAIGLMDGMRIGTDTARSWKPYFKGVQGLLRKEVSLPSASSAVHNALTRSDLHGRWWINDPDCLLLRPETKLTRTEVETIASVIALTGGSTMVSDHVPGLPAERLDILKSILPPIGKRPFVLDWFDSTTPERVQLDLEGPAGSWHLVALFNWLDTPQDKILNFSDFYIESSEEFYARNFWSGQTILAGRESKTGKNLTFNQVPPHGVVLVALRPRHAYSPQYLGGNLHISQGLEILDWQVRDHGVKFSLDRPGKARGRIELAIPGQIERATSSEAHLTWEPGSQGVYSFDMEFDKRASIEILYS